MEAEESASPVAVPTCVLDQPINRPKTKVSLSAYAFLFSEMVQYSMRIATKEIPFTQRPGGITAKKVNDPESVHGFHSYVHENNTPFILSKSLGGGEELGGNDVEGVTKVSIFYWDGDDSNPKKPLLLEIIKNNIDTEKEYYYKYGKDEREAGDQQHIWRHQNRDGSISLQSRLDERNLGINNVFPLDLENPEKRIQSTSNAAKDKGLERVSSVPQLTGTDYVVTEYRFINHDGNTRFSRVMYKKEKANGISVPFGITTNVRLYSSPVNGSTPPLMFEFVGLSGGNSTFFDSKDGRNWGKVINSDGFYDKNKSKDNPPPTELLTTKLDETLCSYYNAATIDLTKRHSGQYVTNKGYCCTGSHGSKRVSVISVQVSCTDSSHTSSKLTAYKHSVPNGKLAGIKFYLSSDDTKKDRKRITSRKLGLPIEGPVHVYAFYCKDNPILVYVENGGSGSPGWYRKNRSNDKWTPTSVLKDITPTNITDCKKWNRFVGLLNQLKCTQFKKCLNSESSELGRSEDSSGGEEENDIKLEESEPEEEKPPQEKDGKKGDRGPEGGTYVPVPPPKGPKPVDGDDSNHANEAGTASSQLGRDGAGKAEAREYLPGTLKAHPQLSQEPQKTDLQAKKDVLKSHENAQRTAAISSASTHDGIKRAYKVTAPGSILTVFDAAIGLAYAVLSLSAEQETDSVRSSDKAATNQPPSPPPRGPQGPGIRVTAENSDSLQAQDVSSPSSEGTQPNTTVLSNLGTTRTQSLYQESTADAPSTLESPASEKLAVTGPGLVLGGLGSWSIFGASSGTLAGSGAVGLAGYKLLKNSRDPWVRQI
ncbi:hypothetical protein BEWA_024200 [Theileria equi strain WA]|uniref:Uncharacterized protein n=1 Tax=Theileria equi strain WA TaxID=1537102 RepID=L0AX20_THEEQ|nr:hypothetical protein BEWA_024200 [Theileria equi strain WA]AFZ79571.1 hypothetical protein BEWA_024200 [Theileria equi strain WA]|eukprot:XP_004829237.1 hypothetical protein BEWA_024200 [Theileria equi strain WA]